jgi:hypothetical protein
MTTNIMDKPFVSPTGYIDLDNDCEYSIDLKSTRSRESILPKEDMAFYFQTYITPKYGLNNINVNNVASFMKDLEMNWTKIPDELKGELLNVVSDLVSNNESFKNDLLQRLQPSGSPGPSGPSDSSPSPSGDTKSSFGYTQSNLGFPTEDGTFNILIFIGAIALFFYFLNKIPSAPPSARVKFT